MSDVVSKVNRDDQIAQLAVTAPDVAYLGASSPVMATPTLCLGFAAASALAGAFAAGYVIGEDLGG